MSVRDFAVLRAKMQSALGKSAFLPGASESSWSSETGSKWSEKTSRRSVTSCNNWVLILIPLLFLSVVAFYFIIVDVGLVSTYLDEKENKTSTTITTYNLLNSTLETTPLVSSIPVSTTERTIPDVTTEKKIPVVTAAATRIRATVTHVYRTPTTPTTTTTGTVVTTTDQPEPKLKLKSNSTLIVLKKGANGTEFMIEGLKFQHSKEMLEVVSPPDLRQKPKFFDDPPTKPLTTPRGFQYSPTVPLIARLQAERADVTTTSYNDTNDVNCFSPRIPFCEGVLPYDMVQLPSLPDVTSIRDLDAMLPYFQLIQQSGCSERAREFICSVLEPECQPAGSRQPSPCKNNCKVLAEDCKDFILETLPLSRIFDCRRYPDWDENQDCVNLSKGRCHNNEFQCPDSSCIPSRWVCDGVHDCPGSRPAADEKSCSGCSPHEFRCIMDGKCIPGHWRCDRQPDCSDHSDELSC